MIRLNALKSGLTAVFRSVLPLTLLISSILFSVDAGYLTAKGSKLYNSNGQVVRLTGVNWFGFETTNFFPHGLWARDYHGMLNQVKEMGFNCLRIPFCNDMLAPGATASPNFYGTDPYYKRDQTEFNKELEGLSPLEMMDEIIKYAGEIGIAIVLDNHSRAHDGYMEEKLWYTAKCSEATWISDWVMLAKRYKGNPAVVAFDLNNEPHGKASETGAASWGTGNAATDWNTAAEKCGNAILEANPDVLIIVEGVQDCESFNYWWGGNLKGVKEHPIKLSNPAKLM